jgi:hypothetical protein
MAELGATADSQALVPGKPDAISENGADHRPHPVTDSQPNA